MQAVRSGGVRVLHVPSRLHNRLHSLFLLVIIALELSSIPAAAYTPVSWNTTALFDSGTKASVGTATDTCENVSANRLALNNTGNYQGIGLTTGTSTCATGAWGVNPAGLVLSYDMQTLTSGKMKDFSPTAASGMIAGTTSGTGDFGFDRVFAATTDHINAGVHSQFNFTTAFTVSVWIKITSLVTNSYFAARDDGASRSWNFQYSTVSGVIFRVWTSITNAQTSGAILALNTWYSIVATWDGANLNVYKNGTKVEGPVALSGTLTLTNIATVVGSNSAFATQMNGGIDEVAIANRTWSASEITAFSTDGRSSFLSSGSWISPLQALTVAPTLVTVTYTGGTSTNYPNRVTFKSGSGTVLFDSLIPFASGGSVSVPVNLTSFPTNYKVIVGMTGNGSATSMISSIVVSLGNPSLFSQSDMIFVFGILLIALAVIGLLLEDPMFGLLTIIAGLLLALWGYWFLGQVAGATNGGVFFIATLAFAVLFTVLGLGKFTSGVVSE